MMLSFMGTQTTWPNAELEHSAASLGVDVQRQSVSAVTLGAVEDDSLASQVVCDLDEIVTPEIRFLLRHPISIRLEKKDDMWVATEDRINLLAVSDSPAGALLDIQVDFAVAYSEYVEDTETPLTPAALKLREFLKALVASRH